MGKVTVKCDSCHRRIKGSRFKGIDAGTSSFYEGPYWHQFMEPGEYVLCDACMQSRPKYQVVYSIDPIRR